MVLNDKTWWYIYKSIILAKKYLIALFEVGKLAIFESSHEILGKNDILGKSAFYHMKMCLVICPKRFFYTKYIWGSKINLIINLITTVSSSKLEILAIFS